MDTGQRQQNHIPVTRFVPPPEPEEEVDEKTRLRRQEALLLPSQPPDDSGSSAADATAPFIPDDANLYQNHMVPQSEEQLYVDRVTPSATSARSVDTIIPSYSNSRPLTVDGASNDRRADDKEELERQRLMREASAPPADGDEVVAESSGPANDPSAPTLTEEDEYNAHTLSQGHDGSDHLPQYQR